MNRTYPIISFGAYNAMQYKQDTTLSCNVTLQGFSYIDDLKLHALANDYPYATLEPDFWLLDGSYKIKPVSNTGLHTGLVTTSMSDSVGAFGTAPQLTVTFNSTRDTDGMIFTFSEVTGDWASSITVAFYDPGNVLIRSDTYNVTQAVFSTNQSVTGIRKIIVTFSTTNKPYRYLRLLDIDYTDVEYFEGANVKSAEMVEQIDPISAEIPFNTIDIELFSNDGDFSTVNPGASVARLQARAPIYVYEMVNSALIQLGTFFIDTWSNLSEKSVAIHAIDTIGVLGETQYLGALEADSPAPIIAHILDPLGITYSIDGDVSGIAIQGLIPICSCREALQQVLFAISAYATCSRSGGITIKSMKLSSEIMSFDENLGYSDFAITGLELKNMVTGVEVTSHDYTGAGDSEMIFKQALPVGDHTIVFDKPVVSNTMVVSGGTQVSPNNPNYIIVRVATPGLVTVTIENLIISARTKGVYMAGVASNKQNIIKIDNATMVGTSYLDDLVQRLYDYYQQRNAQSVKLFAHPSAQIGDLARLETYQNKHVIGTVESMKTNLTRGFIAETKVAGTVV